VFATEIEEYGDYLIIDGQVYGPEDGVETTTGSFEIGNDGQPVGIILGDDSIEDSAPDDEDENLIVPFASWGASYAKSTEYLQYWYKGVGKAAANIYGG